MTKRTNGRVLIVAGSDSGGGAGIQADIKTVTALRGFATTAITALTAQNTCGVHGVHPVPEDFIRQQIQVVADDIGADVTKTGMLGTTAVIEAVTQALNEFAPAAPRIVDPVMMAKGGHPLLEPDAIDAMRTVLIPTAFLITPNLPEASALVGNDILTVQDMEAAADDLRAFGAQNVLLKGGHLEGAEVIDLLITPGAIERFEGPRIDTASTHGTGCTLASAIATGLANGLDLSGAVRLGRSYVYEAIKNAPGLGAGHGPLGHGHTVMPFAG